MLARPWEDNHTQGGYPDPNDGSRFSLSTRTWLPSAGELVERPVAGTPFLEVKSYTQPSAFQCQSEVKPHLYSMTALSHEKRT